MLLGIGWKSLRAKIIAWVFIPTAIILLAVALIAFQAYQSVTEELVAERNQELARLFATQISDALEEYVGIEFSAVTPQRFSAVYRQPVKVISPLPAYR